MKYSKREQYLNKIIQDGFTTFIAGVSKGDCGQPII